MFSFLEYFFVAIISYIFGSFPTAYLLLKLTQKKDIRKEGSGVVGTMNALEVSQSLTLGLSVLLLDILKAVFCLLLCITIYRPDYWIIFVSSVFLIIGHIYPVWLRFQGGRGLAVTAGIMLLNAWIFIIVWIFIFTIVYVLRKNIHISNIIATGLTPFFLFVIPSDVLKLNIFPFINNLQLVLFSIPICFLLILAHRDQIKLIFKNGRTNAETNYR